ncbi:Conserved_hypothetical protein [Hexamita inflata]|uniref:Uncharacterized protein n=1 Tax=Hexamita inflata TaxID=28002 RepID=A0AA86UFD6_9EUKA|nr:Conserved hypothetical protein [Hexamita inflata]CAI9949032.1 Conserved hypothetical protein [Hexamita inflata]
MQIQNKPVQYFLLFMLVSLTTGSLFCWLVLEYHFDSHDMPGKKYNGKGFYVCLLTFIFSGTILHMKLVSIILQKMKFMTQIYMGVAIFIVGLALIPVGAMYVPELLFISEILISYAGCQIYCCLFCLYPSFKNHAVIMSCGFATSTMLFQAVDANMPFYVTFVVWIALLLLVTIFFKPVEPEVIFTHSSKLDKMKEVMKYTKLYPVYLCVLFGTAAKSYYENGFFYRLGQKNISQTNMNYVYSASNFSSILAGLFNFIGLEHAFVINVFISIVFNVIVLAFENEVTCSINLFLMNISSTGVITSALSMCANESGLFESSSIIYLSLLFGDIIGMASLLRTDLRKVDLAVITPSMIIQIISFFWFIVIYRKNLFSRKSKSVPTPIVMKNELIV